jgi:hypothetical protein
MEISRKSAIYDYFILFSQDPDYYSRIDALGTKWFAENLGVGLSNKDVGFQRN